jgi:type VI secretion system secreted protein Hcp
MALNAYLKLKGQKQGDIKGSVTQKGREGKILVIAAEHEVLSPRDAASGQATGKRTHKPFVITKELDKSSPLLYQMLVGNESAVEWELQFWAAGASASGAGAEVQRYSVTLTNARLVDIRFHMLNTKNPEFQRYAEYEEVSFTYQKIQWTWTDGGITAQDDWAQ